MHYSQGVIGRDRLATMSKVEAQLVATEERCRELEKLLAEERAKGAMSEVAHLQAVVKW